ncbi:2,4'-dihydroxyacetophenone dioxygenase family protein [Yunchengibacter salinarum]|uniref:2,4'-dihydroxyacetophenone dioxygenase family protein n=1 Tax=Yunchengibacter salinarum TaxID=3133399 RepID=UPI0035B65649
MSTAQLQKSDTSAIKPVKPRFPAFFDPGTLDWAPWVMEGTWFKLLNVDMKTGGFTMLLKVDADNEAPVHGHLGAVEAYVLEGEFGYEEDRGGVGSYVYEEAGSIHMPTAPDGTVMFAIAHGPLTGYNDDGSIAGVIDASVMLTMAREAGAADHVLKRNHLD